MLAFFWRIQLNKILEENCDGMPFDVFGTQEIEINYVASVYGKVKGCQTQIKPKRTKHAKPKLYLPSMFLSLPLRLLGNSKSYGIFREI